MSHKFAVVDIETTGGMVKRDRIIEIGIVLMQNDQIIDQFQSLVHPERSIPYNITQITGIRDEMVQNAPKFYEIAREIIEWTEGHIFVAQNVRFDYGFIRREFEQLGYTYSRRLLCTARLARRLHPNLKRYNLDNLIRYYQVTCKNRHRALDDARATADILSLMLREKQVDFQIKHLVNQGIKESRLPKNISLERLHEIPEDPGVYYLHDRYGDIVYVGKSKNIKKRIFEHFASISNKATLMQQFVDEFSYTLTGSELIALLLEADEIKRLNPYLNKAQRKKPQNYILRQQNDDDGYINLGLTKINKETASGEITFTVRSHGTQFLKQIAKEFQLCYSKLGLEKGSGPCFAYNIGQCLGACLGKEDSNHYNDRVALALDRLNRKLSGSFFIVEEGREPGEKSVVWVENGSFKGYGYLDQDLSIVDPGTIKEQINPLPERKEHHALIMTYMQKNKNLVILGEMIS